MKPVFEFARKNPQRLVYAEGEDERVLHAVQEVVDEGLAQPILIGRARVVQERIHKLGLRIRAGQHFVLVEMQNEARHATLVGAAMVRAGEADAMLCGTISKPQEHLCYISEQIGLHPAASVFAALNILMLPNRTLFVCDTHVNLDPSAEQVAEMTLLAAQEVRRFGIVPKVALLSHSNFGGFDDVSARKMRRACELLRGMAPELEVEGEMHGDAAMSEKLRRQAFPDSRLKGEANLLIMPNLDAANIAFNLLKMVAGEGADMNIGPVLLGAAKSIHILTPTTTVRRIVNMSALAVAGVKTH